MPVVPRIEPQVREQAPRVDSAPADAPVEAFGGGQPIAKAAKGIAQSFEGLFEKEKEKANRVRITHANSLRLAAKNEFLNNPETGALHKKGQDAFSVVEEYGQMYNDRMAEIRGGLTPEQQAMWDETAPQHDADFNGALYRHFAVQQREYDDEVTKVGVQQAYDDMLMNRHQPGAIPKGLAAQERIIREYADRQGLEGPVADARVKAAISRSHSALIAQDLQAGKVKEADAYFKSVQSSMTPDDIEKTTARMESKLELEENVATYQQMKGYRLADGSPDLARMQREINKKPIPTERKEEMFDFVKGEAMQAKAISDQREAAVMHEFTNKVLAAKEAGKPLQVMLDEVTNKYGGDRVRKKELSDMAKKIYSSAAVDDYNVEWQIRDDILNDRGNPVSDIKAAMRADKLKGDTAMSLMNLIHSHKARFEEQDRQMIYDGLKSEALEKFGKNKEGVSKTNQFLSEVRARSQGKSPEEAMTYGKKLLTDQPAQGFWGSQFPGLFKESSYVKSAQETSDARARKGQLEQDFGDIVTEFLGGGDEKKFNATLKALKLSDAQLRLGQPHNSAIQSLRRLGYPITRKNIDFILSQEPSGVIRGY